MLAELKDNSEKQKVNAGRKAFLSASFPAFALCFRNVQKRKTPGIRRFQVFLMVETTELEWKEVLVEVWLLTLCGVMEFQGKPPNGCAARDTRKFF